MGKANLLLALCSPLVFLLTGELLTRPWWSPQIAEMRAIYDFDSNKIFQLKPNLDVLYEGVELKTNSRGLRDEDILVKKSENELRVLLLGDSVTFGHGVELEYIYPTILEHSLAKYFSDKQVSVINTAAPGNTSIQQYYDFKRALELKPDLVILQFCINDVVEPFWLLRRLGGAGIDYHGIYDVSYLHQFLREHSSFYIFLDELIAEATSFFDGEIDKKEVGLNRQLYTESLLLNEPRNERVKQAWSEYFYWLDRIIQIADLNEIPLYIVSIPVEQEFFHDDYPTSVAMRLKDYTIANKVPFLDLREIFLRVIVDEMQKQSQTVFAKNEPVVVERATLEKFWKHHFLDWGHLNENGHILTASLLSNATTDLLKANSEN